jgi:7,8-dihydropterin-6-yl-methyl-4-(beta-D-ribofuranosyl)aminobenzene 5'-phosphate synthase
MHIKITILVDNQAAGDDSLINEHGLAMLLETPDERVLFDTGYSNAMMNNAERLGIDLNQIDKVVISHGHLDHAGGIRHLIKSNTHFKLIAHPDIFKKKVIINSENSRSFGISEDLPLLQKSGIQFDLHIDSIIISENIMTTGYIPMETDFEEIETRFFIEENGNHIQDSFEDEKALIIKTSLGTVVLLGCSHRGVINILNHVVQVTGTDKIYAIMGGLHLGNVHPSKIDKICAHLEKFDLNKIVVGHCTGVLATAELIKKFGDKVETSAVGKVIEL